MVSRSLALVLVGTVAWQYLMLNVIDAAVAGPVLATVDLAVGNGFFQLPAGRAYHLALWGAYLGPLIVAIVLLVTQHPNPS